MRPASLVVSSAPPAEIKLQKSPILMTKVTMNADMVLLIDDQHDSYQEYPHPSMLWTKDDAMVARRWL